MNIKRIHAVSLISVALLIAACVQSPSASGQQDPSEAGVWSASGSEVVRIYDKRHGVVCYVSDGYKSGGISCLNMKDLK